MAKNSRKQTAKSDTERTCPITGKSIAYAGRGRPPQFHGSATAKQRREYRAALS